MHLMKNKDGGIDTMSFIAPVLIFKQVDGKYYAANMLAHKLSEFCEAPQILVHHIDKLKDMGYAIEVEG